MSVNVAGGGIINHNKDFAEDTFSQISQTFDLPFQISNQGNPHLQNFDNKTKHNQN